MTPDARQPRTLDENHSSSGSTLNPDHLLNSILDALTLQRWDAEDPELDQAWLHQLDEALLLDELEHAQLQQETGHDRKPLADADLAIMRDQALTLLAA